MPAVLWIGLIFAAACLGLKLWTDWPIWRHGVRTSGRVVDHARSTDDGSEYYSAKVRFTSRNGQIVEFTDSMGFRTPRPSVGASVVVMYAASAPTKATIYRPWTSALIYGVLIGFNAILIARLTGWLVD